MPTKIKKEMSSTSTKKEVKNASKKTTMKKTAVKSSTPPKTVKKTVAKHAAIVETKPVAKIIHRFEKRFVFFPVCTNCDHVPMRINKLVALMTVLVAILSGIVIAQAQPVMVDQVIADAVSVVMQPS